MMAAIFNSAMLDSYTAILDSDIILSSLKYTQKHSHSTLTLTQTNSIWLKLIHSHLTWWWQPSWTLPSWIWLSWIQPSWYFLSMSLTLAKIGSHHLHKKTSLIHSDSIWWWQPSWILSSWIQTLPSWILTSYYLLSHFTKNTLTPFWLWLKLIQSDSNSFILTLLDDGSHLEFCHFELRHCHLGFIHLSYFLSNWHQKHSHSTQTLTQTNSIWLKLIHSHLTWWWQPSWILPSWIQQSCFFHFSIHSNWITCQDWFPPFAQEQTSLILSDSTWWWQPSWILPSWNQTLPSWILIHLSLSSDITQKHSHSILTLTQTNSIWLKLIHSHFNLMMAAILNSAILNLAILDSAILVFSLKLNHTCQDWFPPFA